MDCHAQQVALAMTLKNHTKSNKAKQKQPYTKLHKKTKSKKGTKKQNEITQNKSK